MNLNEIENTVQSLINRHPNLDDALLKVLLSSGGWDEKMISYAVGIYHHSKGEELLPKLEEKFLPEEVPIDHLLVERNTEVINDLPKEPQSLLSQSVGTILVSKMRTEKDLELPHDLPLRPFESTTHVWPFARYKEVFYGDVMPERLTVEEKKLAKQHKAENIFLKRVPMTKKERESLIFVSTMLLIVLLLLGYMYYNGRL